MSQEIKVFLLKEETVEELMELTGLTREWFDDVLNWDESFGIEKMYVVPFKQPEPMFKRIFAEVIYNIDRNVDEVYTCENTMFPEEEVAQWVEDNPALHYFFVDVTLSTDV